MRCLVCHAKINPTVTWDSFWRVPRHENMCTECSAQLERIEKPGCPSCSRLDAQGVCLDCERWNRSHPCLLEKNSSLFIYNEFAKDFVARWKYRGDYKLLESIQHEIIRVFKTVPDFTPVSIPLSREREVERGFNQSQAIIRLLGKEVVPILGRHDAGKQSKKGRQARVESLNPFFLKQNISVPVILVDDIYTTGTTIRHAASLLKEGGCPSVNSFTLFR